MTKRWQYSGYINLEYGGLFWREDGADDYVLAVKVTPFSYAGGPDNMFRIEVGSIYMPTDEVRRKRALDCIGSTTDNPSRAELVHAFVAYGGIADDCAGRYTVQIGKPQKASHEFSRVVITDQLHGNASLIRYVRKHFLN